MAATLKVEFLAGTHTLDAKREAERLSKLLSVNIEYEFNNITCICYHNGNYLEIARGKNERR
jgi:hypothetical protein